MNEKQIKNRCVGSFASEVSPKDVKLSAKLFLTATSFLLHSRERQHVARLTTKRLTNFF